MESQCAGGSGAAGEKLGGIDEPAVQPPRISRVREIQTLNLKSGHGLRMRGVGEAAEWPPSFLGTSQTGF